MKNEQGMESIKLSKMVKNYKNMKVIGLMIKNMDMVPSDIQTALLVEAITKKEQK